LRRGEYNTRPRDFYDIYLIVKTQTFDRDAFMEALKATAIHRGTSEQIRPAKEILGIIGNSIELKSTGKNTSENIITQRILRLTIR
jgi:hypothetical protein